MQMVKNRKNKIYMDKYEDLQEVLDYQESMIMNKSEILNHPIVHAYDDVQYIKTMKKQYEEELVKEKYDRFIKMQ